MAEALRDYAQDNRIMTPSTYARDYERTIPRMTASYTELIRRSGGYAAAAPETEKTPETVKRTRKRPVKSEAVQKAEQVRVFNYLTRAGLLRAVILMIMAGVLLIGAIWLSASATSIKYSINKINRQNAALQNEIDSLELKLESANTIERIESYATTVLNMRYPDKGECIYVPENTGISSDFAQKLKEKAFAGKNGENIK